MMDIRGLIVIYHQYGQHLSVVRACRTHLMPTPPAINTTFLILSRSIYGGGQTKLPPTLIINSVPSIFFCFCQSQAAGGFVEF